MKKFFGIGLLALLTTAYLASSCSRDDFSGSIIEAKKQAFSDNFKEAYGNIDPQQDWGFGMATTRGAFTRSMATPACPGITQPYNEAWVTDYLASATEPNSVNVDFNDAGAGDYTITKEPVLPQFSYGNTLNSIIYSGGGTDGEKAFYNNTFKNLLDDYNAYQVENSSYNNVVNYITSRNTKIDKFEAMRTALTNAGYTISEWLNITQEPEKGSYSSGGNFVTNFKITGSYNGNISVAASEGYASSYGQNGEVVYGDRLEPFLARTVVVTGTWTIPENQRMGSGSLIVIANGGKVIVSSGKQLQTVNHARIVVLPGGELTGDGSVEVSNGNGTDDQNYNGGTVSVKKFNNNFGKFQNYGKFLVEEYIGGAKESNFYNHGLVHIKYTGLNNETPNARIYNACQWYCENNMRCRIYEGLMGSSFIVGGQLMVSFSEDGTTDPTYFSLAAGALVKAGSLYNNGTSWTGPTSNGYAVLSIGQFDYMNWVQDHPENGGYFANNLYVQANTWTNVPDGNGMQQKTDDGTINYTMSKADWKFTNVVANCVGNGNVKIVDKGNYEVIPADTDFKLGEKGCTPGFSISEVPDDTPTTTKIVLKESGRIFCEDLGNVSNKDMDYNDVVFDAWIYVRRYYQDGVPVTLGTDSRGNVIYKEDHYKTFIQPLAAGGTMPLKIGNMNEEIHTLFGVAQTKMVNTYLPTSDVRSELCVNLDRLPNLIVLRGELASYYSREGGICLKNIPVWVQQGGEVSELEAVEGEAPQKYRATIGTAWAGERIAIDEAYTGFMAWVNNIVNPWETGVESNLYNITYTYPLPTTVGAELGETDDKYNLGGGAGAGAVNPSGTGSGSGAGSDSGSDYEVTGTEVDGITETALDDNHSVNIGATNFSNMQAATIYVYGTGSGAVQVNGVTANTVGSGSSYAPRFGYGSSFGNTDGFGFTRAGETIVVMACQLGPTNLKNGNAVITGSNFTVKRVSVVNNTGNYSVSQPSGKGSIVYNTSTTLDWGENGGAITIAHNDLKTADIGSKIRIFGIGYTTSSNNWDVQLFGKDWSPSISADASTKTNTVSGVKEVVFDLDTQAKVDGVKDGVIVVQGYNFILKYVTIDNSAVNTGGSSGGGSDVTGKTSTSLWVNNITDENDYRYWSSECLIQASDLPTLANGDIIRIKGSLHPNNGWSLYACGYDWSKRDLGLGWTDNLEGVEGAKISLGNGAEFWNNDDGFVDIPLTSQNDLATWFTAHGLRIQSYWLRITEVVLYH